MALVEIIAPIVEVQCKDTVIRTIVPVTAAKRTRLRDVDPVHIVQIAQLLPGGVDIFRLIVGFTCELAVDAVFKEDVLPRDHRVHHGKHDQHDDHN